MALRLWRLGSQSLWLDEAISFDLASRKLPDLFAFLRHDPHPPLSYLLLRLFLSLGKSEFILRLPSALAGAGTVVVLYFLGRRLFSRGAALLSASGLALSPLHIYYSQDVRMYALLAFFAAGSFLTLALVIGDEAKSHRRRLARWAAYLLFTSAGLYTHYYMVLAVLSQNLIFALSHVSRRANARAWVAAQLLLAVIWMPWLPFLVSQASTTMAAAGAIAWRQTVGPKDLAITALSFCVGHYQREDRLFFALLALPALAVFGAAALLGLKRVLLVRGPGEAICLAYLLPVPLAFLGGVFLPGYEVAYVTMSLPGWFLLLGVGMSEGGSRQPEKPSRPGLWRAALGLLLFVLLGVSAAHYCGSPSAWRADWRGACRALEAGAQPGDTALFIFDLPAPWRYYARGKMRAVFVGQFDPWKGERPPGGARVRSELEARAGHSRRIYLCTYLLDVFDPGGNTIAWIKARARATRKLQFREVEFIVADMRASKGKGSRAAAQSLTFGAEVNAASVPRRLAFDRCRAAETGLASPLINSQKLLVAARSAIEVQVGSIGGRGSSMLNGLLKDAPHRCV